MKNENKGHNIDSKVNRQGEPTSNRMHEKTSARTETKIRGISNNGGQGSHETSNKRTGGDQGNKK